MSLAQECKWITPMQTAGRPALFKPRRRSIRPSPRLPYMIRLTGVLAPLSATNDNMDIAGLKHSLPKLSLCASAPPYIPYHYYLPFLRPGVVMISKPPGANLLSSPGSVVLELSPTQLQHDQVLVANRKTCSSRKTRRRISHLGMGGYGG